MMRTELTQRREQLMDHIDLLESRQPAPASRIAVTVLKARLHRLRKNTKSSLQSFLIRFRARISSWLIEYVPGCVIRGWLGDAGYMGIRPVKLPNNRLLWPVADGIDCLSRTWRKR